MAEKLLKWFIFSVLAALIPLAVSCLVQWAKGSAISLENSLAHGELLLITASLCAASAGELLGSDADKKIAKVIAGGASILILLLTSAFFLEVSSSWIAQKPLAAAATANASLVLFITSVVCSGSCIALSEA